MEIKKLIENISKKHRFDYLCETRIIKTLKGEEVDCLPIIFWKPRNASVPGKTYNMKEQFYNKEKMLYAHLEEVEECAGDAYGAPLCIRPNFGTIFIPAMFGLKYEVFEDNYPWLTTHMTKDDIIKFRFPDIDRCEMMNRAVEYIEYFKEKLPTWIHIYHPDTQGPFDIAHMIYSDNIFYDIYDDPDFVHNLMEICTEMYMQVSRKLKRTIGEKNNECYHGHALSRGICMANGGVRVSEDSATLISPYHIDEFVIPYVKRALQAFGGGFIHYCGKNEKLLDAFLKIDEVRAINFGNPEMYDFDSTMRKFLDSKKCYFGLWHKIENETLDEYIDRMRKFSDGGKRGLVLHFDQSMFPGVTCEQISYMWSSRMGL